MLPWITAVVSAERHRSGSTEILTVCQIRRPSLQSVGRSGNDPGRSGRTYGLKTGMVGAIQLGELPRAAGTTILEGDE